MVTSRLHAHQSPASKSATEQAISMSQGGLKEQKRPIPLSTNVIIGVDEIYRIE